MKEYIVEYETEQLENNTMFYGGKVKHELIRCKDCYFYGTFQRKHYCTKYEHSVKQDGFCAWAEPKVKE